MEAVVCHSVSHSIPFVHTSLLVKFMVWFEAFGFCYTVNIGSSPGLFLDILLLPCVMETLQLWGSRTWAFLLQGSLHL